jgi:hypothetical protein
MFDAPAFIRQVQSGVPLYWKWVKPWIVYRYGQTEWETGRWHFRNGLKQLPPSNPAASPVIILGSPRTGSNLLADCLNQHPAIGIIGEPLNETTEAVGLPCNLPKTAALHHIHQIVTRIPRPLPGLKLFFVHLDRFGISLHELTTRYPTAKWIVLYRRNTLEQLVSVEILRQGGKAIGEQSTRQVALNQDQILQFHSRQQKLFGRVLDTPSIADSCFWLSYETLTAHLENTVRSGLFRWLGLDDAPVTVRLKRQNPRPLAESIQNYPQLADWLKNTSLHLNLPESMVSGAPQVAQE